MSGYEIEPETRTGKIGKAIYDEALAGRRGFRWDQLGIEDDEIWAEIFEAIGHAALDHCDEVRDE